MACSISHFPLQLQPDAQDFAHAPGLRGAPLLRVRRVAVGDLAHVAEAARVQVFDGAREQLARRLGAGPARRRHRLGVERERPRPHRPVVVGGLAARVLVARVRAAVERMVRVERADAARHEQFLGRRQDRRVVDDAERQEEELVRPDRVLRHGARGRFAVRRGEAVPIADGRLEILLERRRGARGGFAAADEAERGDPQRLDLDGIADARRARGIVRVHPREVRRRPDEARVGIDLDPVRRSLEVAGDEALTGLLQPGGRRRRGRGDLLHAADEPELRVGRVAVARRRAVDDVRQRAVLLERREGRQDLGGRRDHPRGDHAAQEDERVAAPVEEPRVARDDRLQVVALDDEEFERLAERLFNPERVAGRRDGRGTRDARRIDVAQRARQRHAFAHVQVGRHPAGAEEVARAVLAARRLLGMRHVVRPLRLVVVRAARDAQAERLAVGRKIKPVADGAHALRERLLQLVRLRRRVEAAPFDVGAEDEPHLVVDVLLARVVALDLQLRRVRAGREADREAERRHPAHAARHVEIPRGEAARRIGREPDDAAAVELARVPFALEPRARARPQVEAVARAVRVGVGRQERVVLALDEPPADAQLARRARAVREDRAEFGMTAHLVAVQRELHLRARAARRHEEARMDAARTARLVDDHHEVERAARRAVALVVRRVEERRVAARRRARAVDAQRLARRGVDEAHAEMMRRGDFHPLVLRHHHVAPRVARIDPVEARRAHRVRRRFGARRRRRAGRRTACEAEDFAGRETDGARDRDLALRDEIERLARREAPQVPFDVRLLRAVEVREDEDGRLILLLAHDGERVAVAARDNLQVARALEARMRREDEIERGDEIDHVRFRAPVEVVPAVDVDLLRAEPLHAVGHAPRALPAQERGELHALLRVRLAALREAVVVVRLGEMDERAVLLAALDRAGEIPLERAAVVRLEDFGVGPVEVRFGEEPVGDAQVAAEPFEHEDGVGIFLADARDDVFPRLGGDHVARVAAEAVDAVAAPEEEDVRHVRAQLGMRIFELDEVGPLHAPRAGADETPVGLAVEPVGMVRLQRRGPAGVVGGKVHEEEAAPRVHRVDELAELVERRRVLVELRHRRIDRIEIERGERAAVLAHDRVRRRHGERRQRLDEAEAHPVHDERQAADDLAERAELAREDGVDGIVLPRLGAFDLDVGVAPLRPFGDVRAVGEEARLAREDADLVERDVGAEDAGGDFGERDVRPGARHRRFAALRLGDDLAAAHPRVADVGAEGGAAPARRVQRQRHGQPVAPPLEKKIVRTRVLCHRQIFYQIPPCRGKAIYDIIRAVFNRWGYSSVGRASQWH